MVKLPMFKDSDTEVQIVGPENVAEPSFNVFDDA